MLECWGAAKEQSKILVGRALQSLRPRIDLVPVEGATLETAQELAKGNRWQEAASHYHTVWETSVDHEQRVESLDWMRMLINLGDYRQIRQSLDGVRYSIEDIGSERLRIRGFAKCLLVEGLVADNTLDYHTASGRFGDAIKLLSRIQKPQRTETEAADLETAWHYSGRALKGLAGNGHDPVANATRAIEFFQKSLAYNDRLETEGRGKPDNRAHQLRHIVGCRIILARAYRKQQSTLQHPIERESAQEKYSVQVHQAIEETEAAWKLFNEAWGGRGQHLDFMAHANLIKGMCETEFGSHKEAIKCYQRALDIRKTGLDSGVAPYLVGYGEAALLLSRSYAREWNFPRAVCTIATSGLTVGKYLRRI